MSEEKVDNLATGSSSLPNSDDIPLVRARPRTKQRKSGRSKRQAMLQCQFLDHQSKVGKEGESEDLSDNSEDDGSNSNESNVTSGSDHSNASLQVYLNSLTSQAEDLGFDAPLNAIRRGVPYE
jgi:hypothetical protein